MDSSRTFWNVTLVCFGISFLASFMLEAASKKNNPRLSPYTWGYYIGVMGTLTGSAFAVIQFMLASESYGRSSDRHTMYGLIFSLLAISHFFIIKRNKWAWIIGIILQFNPFSWVINSIYLKNRWHEMSNNSAYKVNSGLSKMPLAHRTLIAGIIFWTLIVFSYASIFNPYGGYIDNKEWHHLIKIFLYPPVISIAGYFLYSKIIKP